MQSFYKLYVSLILLFSKRKSCVRNICLFSAKLLAVASKRLHKLGTSPVDYSSLVISECLSMYMCLLLMYLRNAVQGETIVNIELDMPSRTT